MNALLRAERLISAPEGVVCSVCRGQKEHSAVGQLLYHAFPPPAISLYCSCPRLTGKVRAKDAKMVGQYFHLIAAFITLHYFAYSMIKLLLKASQGFLAIFWSIKTNI